MIETTAVQTLLSGLVFAKDAFHLALNAKIDSETQKRISEAMSKLDSAQSMIYEMRAEMFDLQELNHNLQLELQNTSEWNKRIEKYCLIKAEGGAVVYKSTFDPHTTFVQNALKVRSYIYSRTRIHTLANTYARMPELPNKLQC